MGDFPDVRIGTTERERALEDLAQHFSAGRLSVTEFDERSARIAAANTRSEVARVFADLPHLGASTQAVVPKKQAGSWDWYAGAIAATPIVAIVLYFTLHSWLVFLLILIVPAAIEAYKRLPRRNSTRGLR
jgi:cytochrome c-type biogenesis protein CcmH/NrfG